MKKIIIFIILLIIPFVVKGQTLVYNVCQTDCEYNELNDVYNEILSLSTPEEHDITINIKDGRTYIIPYRNCDKNISNAKIKVIGTNKRPTIQGSKNGSKLNDYPNIISTDIYYENLKIEATNYLKIGNVESDSKAVIKNVIFSSNSLNFYATNTEVTDSIINVGNVIVDENITNFYMKNTTIEVEDIDDAYIKLLNDNYLIEDSTFKNMQIISHSNEKNSLLNNIIIKGSIYNGSYINIKNSTIDGNFISDNHDFSIKDTTINTNDEAAINIFKSSCTPLTNNSNGAIIDNVKIKGNPKYGILIRGIDIDSKVDINNSDFSNATCSTAIIGNDLGTCCQSLSPNNINPTFLANKYENENIHVTNSLVNGGQVYSENPTIAAGTIYFEDNNTWTEKINRGTNIEENNVVELNNGKVIIDLSNKGTLKLKVDKEKNIADYFKDLVNEKDTLGTWLIEDDSILKIVENKIVPLKVGQTKITASIGNNNYSVYIKVTETDLNGVSKKTNVTNITIIIILLLSITTLLIFMITVSKISNLGK